MTEHEHLRIDRDGRVAVVVIDRPDKLNALNDALIGEIASAFRGLSDDDDVSGLIVTGAGEKGFVAGADIGELARMGPLDGIRTSRRGQDAFRFVERLRKPVVAAVNGYALGGGLELALACHMRLASDRARFGLPEVKLGIIPGYGGTVRLPALVGRGRALEMILSGEMISADEAAAIGLVNRVHPAGELMDAARSLLEKILANGPVAVAMALEAVDVGSRAAMEDALRFESNLFGLLSATEDMKEGMAAFLEKRKADFRGR